MLFLQVMFSRYSVGKCSRLCYGGFRLSVWNQKPCVEASLPLLKHLPWLPAAPDKCRQALPGWGPLVATLQPHSLIPRGIDLTKFLAAATKPSLSLTPCSL